MQGGYSSLSESVDRLEPEELGFLPLLRPSHFAFFFFFSFGLDFSVSLSCCLLANLVICLGIYFHYFKKAYFFTLVGVECNRKITMGTEPGFDFLTMVRVIRSISCLSLVLCCLKGLCLQKQRKFITGRFWVTANTAD